MEPKHRQADRRWIDFGSRTRMRPFFSTDGVHPRNAFRRWREMVCERLVPADLRTLDDVPFQGCLDVTSIGPLLISHFSHTMVRTEATADAVRRNPTIVVGAVLPDCSDAPGTVFTGAGITTMGAGAGAVGSVVVGGVTPDPGEPVPGATGETGDGLIGSAGSGAPDHRAP